MTSDLTWETIPDEAFTDYNLRNPIGAAFYLCDKIAELMEDIRGEDDFIQKVFGNLWSECSEVSEEFARGYINQMQEIDKVESCLIKRQQNRVGAYAFIATAYCILAMKAQKSERINFAWNVIAEAHFWTGAMYSALNGAVASFLAKTEMAKKGAKAAHKENHALREFIWDWYKNNGSQYKSMSQAADAAFTANLAPVRHRTIYDWIRQLNKGEPS